MRPGRRRGRVLCRRRRGPSIALATGSPESGRGGGGVRLATWDVPEVPEPRGQRSRTALPAASHRTSGIPAGHRAPRSLAQLGETHPVPKAVLLAATSFHLQSRLKCPRSSRKFTRIPRKFIHPPRFSKYTPTSTKIHAPARQARRPTQAEIYSHVHLTQVLLSLTEVTLNRLKLSPNPH